MAITDLSYLWGDETSDAIIPNFQAFEQFRKMNLMLSAWDFVKLGKNYAKLQGLGMRQYLGLDASDHRQLMIDSGGFKGYSQNITLDPEIVLKIYASCDLKPQDHVIVLDQAPLPYEDQKTRLVKIDNTIRHYNLMKSQNTRTLQAVHGWTFKELERSIASCETDPLITFPSYFTLLTNTRKDDQNNVIRITPHADILKCPRIGKFFDLAMNNFSPKQEDLSVPTLVVKRIQDFITLYQKRKIESRVHVLGASAGLAFHILAYSGIFQQMDSANWRVKSNHYKIMLAYPDFSLAEGYVGAKEIHYGCSAWNPAWDEYLLRCDCPVCAGLSLAERKDALGRGKTAGFMNRAVHNAFHYYNELTIAKELVGTEAYFRYIDKRVAKSSPFYKLLWRGVKAVVIPHTQAKLDAFLKHTQDRPKNIYS